MPPATPESPVPGTAGISEWLPNTAEWLPNTDGADKVPASEFSAGRPPAAVPTGSARSGDERWLPPQLSTGPPAAGPTTGHPARLVPRNAAARAAEPGEQAVDPKAGVGGGSGATPGGTPERGDGRHALRAPLTAAVIAFVAIIAATAGALILTHRAGRASTPQARPPGPVTTSSTPSAAPTQAAGGPPTGTQHPRGPGTRAPHGLATPFVVRGSRFAVFVVGDKPWTRAAAGITPPPGKRILFVEVLGRRLAPPAVDLQALGFRVVGGGLTASPLAGVGTGAHALGAAQTPTLNQLVVNRLAFEVTGPLSALRLRFEATNAGGPPIIVPLAG